MEHLKKLDDRIAAKQQKLAENQRHLVRLEAKRRRKIQESKNRAYGQLGVIVQNMAGTAANDPVIAVIRDAVGKSDLLAQDKATALELLK
jgi:hypothetical protein